MSEQLSNVMTSEEADKLLQTAETTALTYTKQLDELRKDGVAKIEAAKSFIRSIHHNKMINSEEKANLIDAEKNKIEDAKIVVADKKVEINNLDKEATNAVNAAYKQAYDAKKAIYKSIVAENKAKLAEISKDLLEKHNSAKAELEKVIADAKSGKCPADVDSVEYVKEQKKLLESENISYKNAVREAKDNCLSANQKVKDELHAIYTDKINHLSNIHGNKNTFVEKMSAKAENYVYNFNVKSFFMKNGLYIIILAFMIMCICINPYLISMSSLMLIAKNFSTKIFFALGVAGLILLAGTDLSVGRMVTLGSLITCMMLNPSSTTEFFGISLSKIYGSIGFVPTLILALLFSVIACTAFSALAGFFSAKFKMHPFVATMGTSLIIWGLCGFGTNNVKTGTITDKASSLVKTFGSVGFPLALVYAIIAILVVWFIWNKTTFGKNMYAVGDNAEAAAVSGISVFKVTMGVFVMAGVLYGVGAFLQGLTTGSSSSTLGQGWELEAIAACVVGGISFSGGIGKISGAVIGCALFEILKFYLRDITGGNADITNIFIGIIIITAVTFDCIKYLKKK